MISVVGTSRCDVRVAYSGATPSTAGVARLFVSARYYAGGDGAARHPYHCAKQILARRLRNIQDSFAVTLAITVPA